MNDAIRMQLSAYVDGELPETEAELLLRRVSQDAALRQEAAEYLAIGRLMRGEAGLSGADRLHERVADEIDHRPAAETDATIDTPARRFARPLAGAAIAATVALLAVLGLQQTNSVDEPGPATDLQAQIDGVPEVELRSVRNRQYFLNHANATSALGANGMNSRLVALRFSAEVVEESDIDESADDESTESVTQP